MTFCRLLQARSLDVAYILYFLERFTLLAVIAVIQRKVNVESFGKECEWRKIRGPPEDHLGHNQS